MRSTPTVVEADAVHIVPLEAPTGHRSDGKCACSPLRMRVLDAPDTVARRHRSPLPSALKQRLVGHPVKVRTTSKPSRGAGTDVVVGPPGVRGWASPNQFEARRRKSVSPTVHSYEVAAPGIR